MAYQLVGKTCGTVIFQSFEGTMTGESETASSKMTSNAIEGGGSIEDHVTLNPDQIQVSGILVKNASYYLEALRNMRKTRDLVAYYGNTSFTDGIITNLSIKRAASNKDGFTFTVTLQRANIVSAQYVEMGQVTLMSQQDTNATTSAASTSTKKSTQTSSTKSSGMKTTVSTNISQSAYANYVNSYNSPSGSGPAERTSKGYSGG
ncbi:MAG: phage baseplate protein [Lachnospiraceae bacterium]